ncbi:MAG: hypothetical protein DHS20C05_20190 [Hyphococcus sp.]|nr:MAG: hypothetical protein DHS20C05_20190 [Marinicaulis sp.]
MFRITTIFLCVLLTAAAIGRYRAEESVRKTRIELNSLETSRLQELESIQILRAETAFLENPERLAKIAEAKTDLRPSTQEQMMTERQFASAMHGTEFDEVPLADETPADTISNAIAMAQLSGSQ